MQRWQGRYEMVFGRVTPGVRVLLIATLAAFMTQMLFALAGVDLSYFFGLSLTGLRHGLIWQPVTYVFIHGNLLHFFLNMLVLFFLGPETERALGTRWFYRLYLGSGILGGLGWLAISGASDAVCVGASGAVFGVIGAFAALFPHRRITLLVFFVLPVTMKAWVMAVVLALLELTFMLSAAQGGTVANAAHLAGGLAGYLFVRGFTKTGGAVRSPFRKGRPRLKVLKGGGEASPSRAEIDRLLDKIAQKGLAALTPSERKTLDKASETLRTDRR